MALSAPESFAFTLNTNHILDAISNARVETQPYHYLVCDNVFDPVDYAAMQAMFPAREYFTNVARSVDRLDFYADPASESKGQWELEAKLPLDRTAHAYWYQFRSLFMSDEIMNALSTALGIRPVKNMTCSARLAIDYKDAGLGPHTDRIDKLVSAIFYLGDESSRVHATSAGTQVLVPLDPNREFTQEHYKYSEFAIHEYVEYVPNRLFAFAVANGENGYYSFHGYHQAADFERRTIKYHVHNPVLVQNGVQENQRFKASASDWLNELHSSSKKDR